MLAAVARAHGELHLLVNNAGGSWRGGFAETGWENVERHMKLNFEAPVRLTEALLPLLRATAAKRAPTAIVNVVEHVRSRGPPARGRLLREQVRARRLERRPGGRGERARRPRRPRAPGFIETEGFPATELRRHPVLRLIVSKPDKVAEAIVECGLRGKAERYVPRYYWLAAATRVLVPGLVRRATSSGTFTTATAKDARH